jgi:hypothetical protein
VGLGVPIAKQILNGDRLRLEDVAAGYCRRLTSRVTKSAITVRARRPTHGFRGLALVCYMVLLERQRIYWHFDEPRLTSGAFEFRRNLCRATPTIT